MTAVPPPTVVELTEPRLTASGARLFTSLEGENPSGSIKDRMVRAELEALMTAGALRPGDRVSEVSAGSTARALAHHCQELGLRCDLFVPDVLPESETEAFEQRGATVHRGSRETGYALYAEFCARERPHRFDQLSDTTLSRHYRSLGAGVSARVGPLDAVIGAVGTGHSLLGTAEGMTPRPFVVTAEPAEPYAVMGLRNVELERFGPDDPCTVDLFDTRTVVSADERATWPDGAVATDHGEVAGGASFAVVLSAAARLVAERRLERVFLVGATTRRR